MPSCIGCGVKKWVFLGISGYFWVYDNIVSRQTFGLQSVMMIYSSTYWTDLPLGSPKQNAAASDVLKFWI